MKYAILNKDNLIINVEDKTVSTQAQNIFELTEEQYSLISSGLSSTPRSLYYLESGKIITQKEKIDLDIEKQKLKIKEEQARRMALIKASLPKVYRKQTKLTIMRRLDEMGKWVVFKNILAQLPEIVQDSWLLAQEINESDPLFLANREALLSAIGITSEQLDSLFDP